MPNSTFNQPLAQPWRVTETGNAYVRQTSEVIRLAVEPTTARQYSNAQITDYGSHRDFRHAPPLRLTVTASRPAGAIHGTAGFGFWNHPFAPGERGVRLPRAAWFFFASPPNNLALARDVPGSGWKTATIDATRWQFLMLLPAAPVGFLLMRIPALYRRLWPVGQAALNISECALDAQLLAERHTYTLDWRGDGLTFAVDGVTVHHTRQTPRAPLGFIAWVDNQYAVVTPQGQFGFGLMPVEQEQTLVLEQLQIASW